ncbi:MAG: molybdenum ABC transporter ATP-binding protein [Pseudolabrys sp.]
MMQAKSIEVAFRGTLGRFALDAAFTVPASGITALFGPSGCGKTTVLRCMAGLHRLSDGLCRIGGDVWQDRTSFRPAYKRPVGYVFQEPSLFPHLSVRRNLLFGAPRGGATDRHIEEVIDLLGIAGLLDRSPQNLSGGERQRVAVGRALLSKPELLLMDEPLSALDRQTKDEILPFLERLHASLSLPVIYVSHDITEVERLADNLVLMQAGRIIASGSFSDVSSNPTLPLALTKEAAVSLDAVVKSYDTKYGLAALEVDGGRFTVPMPPASVGSRRRLTVAASNVSLAREPPHATTILNILPAAIVSATPAGEHETVVLLALGPKGAGSRLLARITRRSWDDLGLAQGTMVYAQIKGVALAPA